MKNFLKKTISKFNIPISILVIVLLSVSVIHFNFFDSKTKIYEKYPNLSLRKHLFKSEPIRNNLLNDYNVKFLPYTQFFKVKLNKIKLIFDKEYYSREKNSDTSISYSKWGTFFIEMQNNILFVSDYLGNIYYVNDLDKKINSGEKELKLNKIETNINPKRVFDIFLKDNKLYIAYSTYENGCRKINISFSDLNTKKLKFKKFFNPDVCSKTGAIGRMQFYNHKGRQGILASIGEGVHDKPGKNSQNDTSVFGKIIFIQLDDLKYIIYSKGHRVVQGLYAEKNLILASEHGPKGGDEINKILFGKNYGWPIASYGERYDFNYEKKPFYKKNHESLGFEEPVYVSPHGLGISEILMVPKKFSNFFFKNFLFVTSLNGRSIYLANLDKNFSRIISMEKIFLNERIRDIKYYEKLNSILLAFEENGEIGILKSQN
tara:strand:- start:97 stop:1392 length:1296 start_codon:yes stop_codon:yes gene_type:complete